MKRDVQNDSLWLLAGIVILVAIVGSWLLGLPLFDPCFHLCG